MIVWLLFGALQILITVGFVYCLNPKFVGELLVIIIFYIFMVYVEWDT